ncbi:pseudouridine synthase [Candidatus Uhrbacteria bacterium]|nr:pseudouridine synthase [Candidatus Uhrbacteria bacterium]
MRINKFLSESGAASRREGDTAIRDGRVTINGRPAVLGDSVEPKDTVRLDGQVVRSDGQKHYLLFNKPVGIITTTDSRSRDNIMEAISQAGWPVAEKRVFPIGRLDVASNGLILLTNDSEVGELLLRKEGGHEKEYLVTVDQPVSVQAVRTWERGMDILGQRTLPAKVRVLKPDHFSITLVQGLNRQIRRMCEAFGYRIVSLKRVRIMNLHLDRLRSGQYRELTRREIRELRQAIGLETDRRERPVRRPPARPTRTTRRPATKKPRR